MKEFTNRAVLFDRIVMAGILAVQVATLAVLFRLQNRLPERAAEGWRPAADRGAGRDASAGLAAADSLPAASLPREPAKAAPPRPIMDRDMQELLHSAGSPFFLVPDDSGPAGMAGPPMGRMVQMQRQMRRIMDETFDDFLRLEPAMRICTAFHTASVSPAMDMREGEDGYVVSMHLPGMREEDISVVRSGCLLDIRGRHRSVEGTTAGFTRRVRLPGAVMPGGTSVAFSNGLLRIVARKALPGTEPPAERED